MRKIFWFVGLLITLSSTPAWAQFEITSQWQGSSRFKSTWHESQVSLTDNLTRSTIAQSETNLRSMQSLGEFTFGLNGPQTYTQLQANGTFTSFNTRSGVHGVAATDTEGAFEGAASGTWFRGPVVQLQSQAAVSADPPSLFSQAAVSGFGHGGTAFSHSFTDGASFITEFNSAQFGGEFTFQSQVKWEAN